MPVYPHHINISSSRKFVTRSAGYQHFIFGALCIRVQFPRRPVSELCTYSSMLDYIKEAPPALCQRAYCSHSLIRNSGRDCDTSVRLWELRSSQESVSLWRTHFWSYKARRCLSGIIGIWTHCEPFHEWPYYIHYVNAVLLRKCCLAGFCFSHLPVVVVAVSPIWSAGWHENIFGGPKP